MAICEPKPIDKEEEELAYYITDSDGDSVGSEDSEEDPTYEILEETRSNLSNLSIKKPKSRVSKKAEIGSDEEEEDEVSEVKVPELSEKDAKSFEEIEKIIQAGQLEKLKVEQCKIYLRKYGLRLTGKKEILMERIREHLEVVDGSGEKKYAASSFVLNCKGDACTGDVVMFEQNVYDMYSIVSRSATAPPLGTRVVVGRIVKESYGAAKQQHTFTIEVLWSKGEKPLPPLHPLLIKGRNLYRLKTMRQRWADEGERRRVLQEKHSRGSLARCSRDTRIQAKELRMHAGGKRLKKNTTTTTTTTTNNNNNKENKNQLQVPAVMVPSQELLSNHRPQPLQQHYNIPAVPAPALLHHNYKHPMSQHCNNIPVVPAPTLLHHNFHFPVQAQQSTVIGAHRQPLANMNSHPQLRDRSQNYPTQDRPWNQLAQGRREPCRFYPQGRCYYGDSCKYLHH